MTRRRTARQRLPDSAAQSMPPEWQQDAAFLQLLEGSILPQLYDHDIAAALNACAACRSWRNSGRGSEIGHVFAKAKGQQHLKSLTHFLSARPKISSLCLTMPDAADTSEPGEERITFAATDSHVNAVKDLLFAVPSQCKQLVCRGPLCLPLVLVAAAAVERLEVLRLECLRLDWYDDR